ncbi:tripartite tricarboxylate transporter substrate binding protein (plasmid) [Skermanella mucosa]|uniref:Bug family tripartite tricarboxylate transporter substrate binding protein n=1 Tax=Skermanella mucosa TaxID=1789672 RepID=UPI00192B329B|nr:tripartite tricarboxylate transporter substrate binding protein [Skermanella mucosa]UEM24419.1 tripartite tricarboxylate transporter substrate binding protein [Skermanella mucosa]
MIQTTRRTLLMAGAMVGALALGVLAPQTSLADEYPSGRVNIIVPFNAGGSADRMARAIATYLPDHLKVPVTVVNRPGASGALGHAYFQQQPDDGHTLLVSPVNPYLISNVLRDQAGLDWDNFAFINGQWQDYYVLLVNKDSPFKTAGDLIDFIRDNPGEASSAIIIGDGGHLSTLIMLEKLGIPKDAVNFVTYDGGGPMRTALAGNQVSFSVISGLGSEVIRDNVRPLAVFRKQPHEAWDAPLINEVLKPYNVEIPVIPADLRTLTVHASFKEKYPERFEKLTNVYRQMLESKDFQEHIEKAAIGGEWMGPEATTESLNESYEVFSQWIDVLEN